MQNRQKVLELELSTSTVFVLYTCSFKKKPRAKIVIADTSLLLNSFQQNMHFYCLIVCNLAYNEAWIFKVITLYCRD